MLIQDLKLIVLAPCKWPIKSLSRAFRNSTPSSANTVQLGE